MNKLRIKEAACVVVLLVFILVLSTQNKQSSADLQSVFDAVSGAVDVSALEDCAESRFKKEFGLDAQEFDDVRYLASDDVMEVRELLLVKLPQDNDGQALLDRIKARVNDKAELFAGYAPEQSGYLESYVLLQRSGYVLYVVSDTPDEAVRAFKKAL
ncbi:MAG: DUF4358 domain-containing protein [Clostridia bacterium]|nr:DUF4358 domain-containing protein [Clostridia bacterium]MBQ6093557.1 DUF4358 domain-containing protein [Clostridia bacterium]MBR3094877.1 DUF4358 domain-containing protein [Clostridia bacterium]